MGNIRSKAHGVDERAQATCGSVASHFKAHNDALRHANGDIGDKRTTCDGSMDCQSDLSDIGEKPSADEKLRLCILSKETLGPNDWVNKGSFVEECCSVSGAPGLISEGNNGNTKSSEADLSMKSIFPAVKPNVKTADQTQRKVHSTMQIQMATLEFPQWHVARYCNDFPSEKIPSVEGNKHSFYHQEVVFNAKRAGRIKKENSKWNHTAEIGDNKERRYGLVGFQAFPKRFLSDAIHSMDGLRCFNTEYTLEQKLGGNGNPAGLPSSISKTEWSGNTQIHDAHSFNQTELNCKHSKVVDGYLGAENWSKIVPNGFQSREVRGKKRQRDAEEQTNSLMQIDIETNPGFEKRLKVSHIFGGGETITCARDMNNGSANENHCGRGGVSIKPGSVHNPPCVDKRFSVHCSDDRSLLITDKTSGLRPVKVLSKKKKGSDARRRWLLNRLRERTVVGLSEWMGRL